jgi:hypothetical protein
MKKQTVLCALGAAVVLLAIAAGALFGSDEPRRVTISKSSDGRFSLEASNVRFPISQQKDVDVVIGCDFTLEGTLYHDGDRLTSEDGKLVKQSWYQIARSDIRYWASRARRKVKGNN